MTVRILQGDARTVLATLPANSVQCCVTSPPYLGLRDYQTATWDGGDPACDHAKPWAGGVRDAGRDRAASGGTFHDSPIAKQITRQHSGACPKCGATRIDAQIGREASPEAYIAALVGVFREVKRVLRDDATLFLNLGDSYNNFRTQMGPGQAVHGRDELRGKPAPLNGGRGHVGLKEKDLMMMPARVALALQADGWTLRSQMPWLKRSTMPESVGDRPTSAVEYVYLFTKGPHYYWDAAAVQRVGADSSMERLAQNVAAQTGSMRANGGTKTNGPMRAVGATMRNFRNSDLFFDSLEQPYGLICDAEGLPIAIDVNPGSFAGAHFATFSPKLIEPLIRAGTSERGCCAVCGAPWVRMEVRTAPDGRTIRVSASERFASVDGKPLMGDNAYTQDELIRAGFSAKQGLIQKAGAGWSQSCSCPPSEPVPCTVLDCFAGAFTAPMVADRLQRHAIGIELSEKYCAMARARIIHDAGMFADLRAEATDDAR